MKRFYFLLACVLTLTPFTNATNAITQTVRGTVVDAVSGFPLIGANVVLLDSDPILGTTTDSNGQFELANVPIGRRSFQISYLGYKTSTINNILINSGKEFNTVIQLEEDITKVKEVVVKAKYNKINALNEMAPVSARTFSVEETERFAGSLGDPARMVANYAGVASNNDARNDIIIRGNSPSGVLWRLEGIEIPNPNHFGAQGTTGGPVSMINNNLLANSDFMTGAFPAEYGNALAGAFDLNLRSGNSSKFEYLGQIGFNGFELGTEGPLFKTGSGQKASFIADFRYSTLEVMHDLGFGSGTGAAIPEYKDFTFFVDIPGTKAGRFKVFGLWGTSYIELGRNYTDTSDNAYNGRGTATNFGSDLIVVGTSHKYFFNEKTSLKTVISIQNTSSTTQYDSVKNYKFINPEVHAKQIQTKITASTQLKYKQNAKNNYKLGLIADYYNFDYADTLFYPIPDTTINSFNGDHYLIQTFAQWQHKFSNNVSTFAGIHSQYFTNNNDIAIEPRMGLKWEINPRHSLNIGFGMHSQLQQAAVYYTPTHDTETNKTYETNKNLKFTKSNHLVVGYNYLINQNFRIKTESYYQYLYDVPVKASDPSYSLLNSGADFSLRAEDSLVNKGTGTNYGIELTIEKFLDNGYYFLVTTSLFDSKYRGYDKIERNTVFNGNYIFNALAGYEYKINEKFRLTFDIKTTWAGGKRYVPLDVEKSKACKTSVFDWEHAYEKKYNDYFRTDLRIGFKHNGKHFNQEWGVDLQNITNYKSLYMQMFDPNTLETYNTYQQGFMPMMLWRIQF